MLGIITIAQGEQRYINMAKMLALSLTETNPGIKRAVVTDAPANEFDGLYDICIPYNNAYGNGLSQKLFLDKYSPFDETFFIDADCLVVKSLDTTIQLCRRQDFAVFGNKKQNEGNWYMDIAMVCKKFEIQSVTLFNGGIYYFKKGTTALNIYNKARELRENYSEYGFDNFRGSINEEPLIAVAMALNNIDAVDDEGNGMRTPIGITGPFKIDVLKNICSFNKVGVDVEPAIVHFVGPMANLFHYKRETAKLKLINKLPFFNKALLSFLINICYNVPYAILVFFKRVAKMILRSQKFNFADPLPIFSNQ